MKQIILSSFLILALCSCAKAPKKTKQLPELPRSLETPPCIDLQAGVNTTDQ